MLATLQIRNFKSWQDSGEIRLAPLTGFFGVNSSGKSSLLQALLALKMTAASSDRGRVLETGDYNSLVELGALPELLYQHDQELRLELRVGWALEKPWKISNPQDKFESLFDITHLEFDTSIKQEDSSPSVESFSYAFDLGRLGMKAKGKSQFELTADGFIPRRIHGRAWPLPKPVKCYAFPDEAVGYYQNTGFLPGLALAFEDAMEHIAYLGPAREWPRRYYRWSGEAPKDLDFDGEHAVHAILAAKAQGKKISRGKGRARKTVEEMVAHWMHKMGLLDEFAIRPIAKGRRDFEVVVRRPGGPEVLLPDVGFGVSQLLPVLALAYYAEKGTTLIIEHPEIHLHPAAQAELADMLIDVAINRQVQVIFESHSEHLVRRLQRRIAEGALPQGKTALYFCKLEAVGSKAERLEINDSGDIVNWPENFFGDEFGDITARTEAAISRQGAAD